jgi:threonine aldolase
LNPTPHEAQLDDQKPKKNSRRLSRRRKNHKNQQMARKVANQIKSKEKLKLKTPPENKVPLTLSMQALPLR